MAFPPPNSGKWTTGLFGCFEDIESCCCGYWCPCILIGRYIEVIDQGSTSCFAGGCVWTCLQLLTGCGCIYSCGYRGRLRQKFGLPASPCGDCLTECCCLNCSACQIYRELKNRGVNPELGYEGVKQVYEAPSQPPPQQYMPPHQHHVGL